jgi:glycolate oxidase FAD binding subunit
MMKLHHGALGSLGVIVAASFKVFPKPLRDVTVARAPGSIDEAWAAAERALALPLPPAALELFSDCRVLGRFQGSADAVDAMVAELGWPHADAQVWIEHSRRGPDSWARIAAPRDALRSIIAALPTEAEWWSSPGIGLAQWSFGGDVEAVRAARAAAEAAGGSLIIMAAPPKVVEDAGAWGTAPPTLGLMLRLKEQFDPKGILNPGRFVV